VSTLLFVYGTLKSGCTNHRFLATQTFIGVARTVPGFRLYDLGGFPGITQHCEDTLGVSGEVWSVDAKCLEELDRFEGVHEGLYRRRAINLQSPFADHKIDAYFPALPVTGRPEVGSDWVE
jgi:gamma-glutamylaminecyclotransferase